MPAGADQGERAKPARAANRDFGRDPAAERMADEMHLIEAERLDEVEIEIGEVGKLIEPVRRVGPAEAGMIRHDHVIALRQRRHERQPGAGPARAMQEQQRRALAAAHDIHRTIGDADGLSRAGSQDGTLAHAVDRRERMDLPVVRSTPPPCAGGRIDRRDAAPSIAANRRLHGCGRRDQ